MPQLTEQHRSRLDDIVRQMSDNGESDDDIKFVVSDYKSKYGLPDKPVSAEDFAPEGPGEGLLPKNVTAGGVLKSTLSALNPLPAIASVVSDSYSKPIAQRVIDAPLGPLAPIVKGEVSSMASNARKAFEDAKAGQSTQALAHLAGVVPILGTGAVRAGEDIASGKVEQGLGEGLATAGSVFAPRVNAAVAPRLASIAEQLAAKGKNIPPAALEIASHVPGIGGPIKLARGAVAAAKAINTLSEAMKPKTEPVPLSVMHGPDIEASLSGTLPGPAPVPHGPELAPNAGGTLVPAQAPSSIESMLADSLAEIARQKAQPSKVTTPPQPDLPPNYTPRTTVPKPKPAKMTIDPRGSAAERARQAAASIGDKNYFLRTPAADTGPPVVEAPTRTAIDVNDLPASWRGRVGPEPIKPQGAAGTELADAFRQELANLGVSAKDAIAAVTRNTTLTPAARLQIINALKQAGR